MLGMRDKRIESLVKICLAAITYQVHDAAAQMSQSVLSHEVSQMRFADHNSV